MRPRTQLPGVQVVLHGGEPLLAGHARLRRVITELRQALDGVCRLDLRIHTNGVLLSEQFCELFAEHGVKVGISIDGDRAANDRHRRYADGRSSYDKVIRAIGLLRTDRFRDLYAGLLCTIDIANDPVVVYESLMDLEPPRIDFLLPHATWDHPPVRRGRCRQRVRRLADRDLRPLARGRPPGPDPDLRFDHLHLAWRRKPHRGTGTRARRPRRHRDRRQLRAGGLAESSVRRRAGHRDECLRSPMDVVGQHPGILARQQGIAGLCQTCQECPVVTSCGGGLYTHRYRAGSGFANPSRVLRRPAQADLAHQPPPARGNHRRTGKPDPFAE